MNNITVKDFVDTYNNLETDIEKQNYISSIIKTYYIPIQEKMFLAEKIIANTYWDDLDKKNKVEVSSINRYILHVYTIINNYTYIHMDNGNMGEEYDMLAKYGLVSIILNSIEDVKEFNSVENMAADDFMVNNYGSKAYLQDQINRISELVKDGLSFLQPTLVEIVKDIPKENIIQFVKKYGK